MTAQKNPRNVIQGARNRAAGGQFESMIGAACEFYRGRGVAEIEKTPEPMQPTRDMGNGKFIAHYTKRAQPDFKGTLSGGQAVVFDAKHTESDNIKQAAVTDEQVRALNRHFTMGAECFILISFGFRLFYRVPWAVWRDMKTHYARKYIRPEDVTGYRVSYDNGILHFLRKEQG